MTKSRRASIPLDQLELDTSNFRLVPADTQGESLDNMLEEQQGKLVELAGDIVANWWSPAELLMVIPAGTADRYDMCECNRPLTALQLLKQPRLARARLSLFGSQR